MKPLGQVIAPSLHEAHIEAYVRHLSSANDALRISWDRRWLDKFARGPGVYTVFIAGCVIYVGETGSLRGRMQDIRRTQNHTLRRQLGAAYFGNRVGFQAASASIKFPAQIERLLDKLMMQKLWIKAASVDLGRKEIEERLIRDLAPRFNIKTRRGDLLELAEA